MNNKHAIVTGASSGIGRETARLLAKEGWRVLAVARRAGRLEELKKEYPNNIEILPVDVTQDGAPQIIIDTAQQHFTSIDLLINNAGASWVALVEQIPAEKLDNILDVNVRAVMRLCKEAIKPLKQSRGQIINIASVAAHIPMPTLAVYCASKAAVIVFSKVLARELAEDGVRVNVFSPSGADTEVFENAGVKAPDKSQVAPPADMAQLIVSMTRLPKSLDIAELATHQRLMPI